MNKWNIYPRPSLRRSSGYQIINDGWKLNGKEINVPFPPESKLSGYDGEITSEFIYQRNFLIPDDAKVQLQNNGHLLLHIGAVDQVCSVFVNDKEVGHSELGYFEITCDITDVAKEIIAQGKDVLDIQVKGQDYLDHTKPYGKQKVDRGGMWYTPVSGIWQTVWCEWTCSTYISKINFNTVDKTSVAVEVCTISHGEEVKADVKGILHLDEGEYEFNLENNRAVIDLSKLNVNGANHNVKLWSQEKPYLYDVEFVAGGDKDKVVDKVQSYFALRTVSIKDVDGYKRICINDKPVFLNGVLDQGYYEKGIFVPEEPEEYTRDILRMKELGFNILRKHIKVEPEIFYYQCDRLGMFVLQDMINNGDYNFNVDTVLGTMGIKFNDAGRYKNEEQKNFFRLSAFETLNRLHNHPSVIGYTVFNEGWGQTDSDEIGDSLKAKDPSRFYDYTSGWFEQKNSDVKSLHVYFRTKKLKASNKPLILSEFGGFTREVKDHIWNTEKSYGYGKCNSQEQLTDKIITTYQKMVEPGIKNGLCCCIYTQLSDVEDEINGFYTYDREVCKVDKDKIAKYMKGLKI